MICCIVDTDCCKQSQLQLPMVYISIQQQNEQIFFHLGCGQSCNNNNNNSCVASIHLFMCTILLHMHIKGHRSVVELNYGVLPVSKIRCSYIRGWQLEREWLSKVGCSYQRMLIRERVVLKVGCMVGHLFQKDSLVIGKEVYMRYGNAMCESH